MTGKISHPFFRIKAPAENVHVVPVDSRFPLITHENALSRIGKGALLFEIIVPCPIKKGDILAIPSILLIDHCEVLEEVALSGCGLVVTIAEMVCVANSIDARDIND